MEQQGTDNSEQRLQLRSDAAEWREIDGEVIALDRKAAVYLAGNSTATILWRALAEGTTRAQLVTKLTETFGIDESRAATDVDDFLTQLQSRGLLDE